MKCFIPNCEEDAKLRGMCKPCYQAVSQMCKVGVMSWDDVIAKGWAFPPKPLGRPAIESDEEITRRIVAAYPNSPVPSREAFFKAIGGSEAILSKYYKGKLDGIFPRSESVLEEPVLLK